VSVGQVLIDVDPVRGAVRSQLRATAAVATPLAITVRESVNAHGVLPQLLVTSDLPAGPDIHWVVENVSVTTTCVERRGP
jgi:hypothetical protein